MRTYWAAQWNASSKLSGVTQHLIHENCLPKFFRTRREARDFIEFKYGYIANRPDLKKEPHGWTVPRVVKVVVLVVEP